MTPGNEPRGFAIDPSGKWVLVGNQIIGSISIFSRDKATGKLTDTGKTAQIDQPVDLLFV
jgi:6-phosphogluconolactonase